MAEEPDRRTYPRFPTKNWWALRARFQQSVPREVDADYLQSVLGLASPRGAANLLAPLRSLGLIDADGRPGERANAWRLDESYKQVCSAMLEEVYPDNLRSAFPEPSSDVEGVVSWFSRNTGSGRSAASAMASLYALLASGDPEEAKASSGTSTENKIGPSAKRERPKPPRKATKATERDVPTGTNRRIEPELNINVQVHISSDATIEQIDQIFKSMGTHLYRDPPPSDD